MTDQIRKTIRKAMKDRKYTQATLGERVGIYPSNLSNILTGKTNHMPRVFGRILEECGLVLIAVPKDHPLANE